MYALAHFSVFLVAFAAPAGQVEFQRSEAVAVCTAPAFGEAAALASPTAPGCVVGQASEVRSELPAPPGPPRKSNPVRPRTRVSQHVVAVVALPSNIIPRLMDDNHCSAILWKQTVASTLRLQHVLLQI